MRKAIAAATLTTALVGLPALHTVSATAPPDTVNSAVVADNDDDVDDDEDSNTGLWGLLGLLGLIGLAGLARRRNRHFAPVEVPAAPPTAYGATSDPDRLP
jgi:LPXTG-motif cell wall-anchored protein